MRSRRDHDPLAYRGLARKGGCAPTDAIPHTAEWVNAVLHLAQSSGTGTRTSTVRSEQKHENVNHTTDNGYD